MPATIEEIKVLWANVDALDRKFADLATEYEGQRWNLAQALYEASKQGGGTMPQKDLAEAIGKSPLSSPNTSRCGAGAWMCQRGTGASLGLSPRPS